jgi:hypothetical protein
MAVEELLTTKLTTTDTPGVGQDLPVQLDDHARWRGLDPRRPRVVPDRLHQLDSSHH